MTLNWLAQNIVSAALGAVVYAIVGGLITAFVLWWKGLPFLRKHKPAIKRAVTRVFYPEQ